MLKLTLRHLLVLAFITLVVASCKQHKEIKPEIITPSKKTFALNLKESKAIEELAKLYRDKDIVALKNELISSFPTSLKNNLGNVDLLDQVLLEIQVAFAEKLLSKGVLKKVQPMISAITAKYPNKFTELNEKSIRKSIKQNQARLKRARLSKSECRRITGKRIYQTKSDYYHTVKRHMRIVAGRYGGKVHNYRRLFEMALFRHSQAALARLGYFYAQRNNRCEDFQLVPDVAALLGFLANYAGAQHELEDIAEGFGARAHFTNIGSIYNVTVKIKSLPNRFLRPSRLARKNYRAVVSPSTRFTKLHIRWLNGEDGKVIIEDDKTKRLLNGGASPMKFIGHRGNIGNDHKFYIEPGSTNYSFRLRSVQRKKHTRFVNKDDGYFNLGNGRGAAHEFFLLVK